MNRLSPLQLILIGILLMVLGWVFPFLMVIHLIASSYWLNFLSYTFQVTGLFTGIIGAASYVGSKKKQ